MDLVKLPRCREDEIQHIVSFLGKTEGRDKATKLLQYACRALAWLSLDNTDISKKFASVYKTSADSRKMFRLGKWLNEFVSISRLIITSKKGQIEKNIQLLKLISRCSYFLYWIADNYYLLAKMGLMQRNLSRLVRWCGLFWLVGLLAGVASEYLLFLQLSQEETKLGGDESTDDTSKIMANQSRIKSAKKTAALNIIKNTADIVTASQMCGLPLLLTRRPLNDGVVGLAGVVSASISCSQLYD